MLPKKMHSLKDKIAETAEAEKEAKEAMETAKKNSEKKPKRAIKVGSTKRKKNK